MCVDSALVLCLLSSGFSASPGAAGHATQQGQRGDEGRQVAARVSAVWLGEGVLCGWGKRVLCGVGRVCCMCDKSVCHYMCHRGTIYTTINCSSRFSSSPPLLQAALHSVRASKRIF